MIINIYRFTVSILFFLSFVLPNSIRPLFVAFIGLSFLMSLLHWNVFLYYKKIFVLYGMTLLITVIYFIVGVINGASVESVYLNTVVYIIFPFLWIIVCIALFENMEYKVLLKFGAFLLFLACFSVYAFYFLFKNYGPHAVSLFISEEFANSTVDSSGAGMTMHVFGTFIFSVPFLFVMLTKVNSWVMFFLAVLVGLVAYYSGRGALLSIYLFSLSVFIFYKSRKHIFIVFSLLVPFLTLISYFYLDIDVSIISRLIEKILSGGGSERVEQFFALLEGINVSYGLGIGHGIPAEVIRNSNHPWRYELMLFSTFYHVGFLGLFIYLLPFLYSLTIAAQLIKLNHANHLDFAFALSLIAMLIVANSNPYIMSISFQWMYVMPVIYFQKRRNELTCPPLTS
ncbi:hypothetical protein [Vibrio inusitatus]|uniref:hypothetical protein n=1 Tax=Vibrio inusitatus TaxID=413402 RepID=UPI0011424648|nr:hypothetical protein [Vibrio inusitatus]